MSDKNAVSPVKHFIGGGIGGVCSVIVEHPFETTLKAGIPLKISAYPALLKDFVQTVRKEGVGKFYKGVEVPIAAVAPVQAVTFFSYAIGKRLLQRTPSDSLLFPGLFLAGAFSGFLKTLILAPKWDSDVVKSFNKSLLSADFPSTISLLHKETGIRSLFKGKAGVFCREIPATGLYFMTYEGLRNLVTPFDERSNICIIRTIFAGGTAGVVYKCAILFGDELFRHVQPSSGIKGLSSGLTSMMKGGSQVKMYKESAPMIIRAFPASAACFLGFQISLKLLNVIAPNPI